jgi:hypothetical protein
MVVGGEPTVVDVTVGDVGVVLSRPVVVVVSGLVVVVVGGTVVVVGRDGGGGSDGTGTSGRSGKGSWEQSSGSPVSPSTKLQ